MPSLGTAYVTIRGDLAGLKSDLNKALEKIKGVESTVESSSRKMTKSFLSAALGARAIETAVIKLKTEIVATFKAGFNAVEDFRLSTASLASTITTFSQRAKTDLPGAYKEAYSYSTLLVRKMEEWDAKTVATGKNLSAMVETMAQGGVLIDVYNKKQEQGFLAIANALALVTQGQNQDIQFRQEVRGLIDGEVKATNRLATLLDNAVGGTLKDSLSIWKEQGTVIENVGKLLSGFNAGAKDLENTWTAISTTLETQYTRILRGGFEPVYNDILRITKSIATEMNNQGGAVAALTSSLREGLYKAWIDIKNVAEIALNIIATFEGPLVLAGKLTALIADGWGMIIAVIVPITERIKSLVQSMWEVAKAGFYVYETLYKASRFDFAGASQSIDNIKASWSNAGKLVGEAFSSSFLDEIDSSLAEYSKNVSSKSSGGTKAPLLTAIIPNDEETEKALKKISSALESFFEELDDFQKRYQSVYHDTTISAAERAVRLQVLEIEASKDAIASLDNVLNDFFEDVDLVQASTQKSIHNALKADANALKKQEKEWQHYLERVQDATADTFYDIFDGNVDGWSGMLDRMGDLLKRALAEWAAQALLQPVIIPIIQSTTGLFGSVASGATGGTSSNGLVSQVGSWLWNETGLGEYASGLLGLGAGSSMFGAGMPTLSASASLYAANPATTSIASQLIASEVGGITPSIGITGEASSTIATFSNVLSKITPYLAAFSLGSYGYTTVADWAGIETNQYSGLTAGTGAVAGYYAGSVIPVIGNVLGAVVGAIVGGLSSLLFGSDTPDKDRIGLGQSPGVTSSFDFWDMPDLGNAEDYAQYFGGGSTYAGLNEYDQRLVDIRTEGINAAITESLSATYEAVNTWTSSLPDELASMIMRDLGETTINLSDLNTEITVNRDQERITARLTEIATDVYEMAVDQISPVIENAIADYLSGYITDMSGTLDLLSSNHTIKQYLGNSTIFNEDYTKATDASFEDYTASVAGVLTALTELQTAWDAVSVGFDQMITPLSKYKTEMANVTTTVNSALSVLEQLGFSEESLAEARERGNAAIQAVTDRAYGDLRGTLTDRLNKLRMSDEDYARSQILNQSMEYFKTLKEMRPDLSAKEWQDAYQLIIQWRDKEIDAIKETAEEIEDATSSIRDFKGIQLQLAGHNQNDITMYQLGQKYNWGDAFKSGNGYDWQALMEKGIQPLLTMSFEEFSSYAESIGIEWTELADDALSLRSVFDSLNSEVKASIDTFSNLSDSIQNQILGMQTSSDNPADIYERIGIENQFISDYLGGKTIDEYLSGLTSDSDRATAITDLQGMFGDRLALYQEGYQRPSDTYNDAYNAVLTDLGTLKDYADLIKTDYELQSEQTDYLKQIADNTMSLLDIPQAADGAWTGNGGLFITHPNEVILNPSQQAAWLNGGSTQPAGDTNTTVNITINATGGNSEEVADIAVAKIKQQIVPILTTGVARVAIQTVMRGR